MTSERIRRLPADGTDTASVHQRKHATNSKRRPTRPDVAESGQGVNASATVPVSLALFLVLMRRLRPHWLHNRELFRSSGSTRSSNTRTGSPIENARRVLWPMILRTFS